MESEGELATPSDFAVRFSFCCSGLGVHAIRKDGNVWKVPQLTSSE